MGNESLHDRGPAVKAAGALGVGVIEPGDGPAWDALIVLDPSLEALRREAAAERDRGGPYYCPNQVYYTRYKPRLERRVGWGAPVTAAPLLQTSAAYEEAVAVIVRAIGGRCRSCGCLEVIG